MPIVPIRHAIFRASAPKPIPLLPPTFHFRCARRPTLPAPAETALCRLYRAALTHRASNPAHVSMAMNGATARRSRHPDSCRANPAGPYRPLASSQAASMWFEGAGDDSMIGATAGSSHAGLTLATACKPPSLRVSMVPNSCLPLAENLAKIRLSNSRSAVHVRAPVPALRGRPASAARPPRPVRRPHPAARRSPSAGRVPGPAA